MNAAAFFVRWAMNARYEHLYRQACMGHARAAAAKKAALGAAEGLTADTAEGAATEGKVGKAAATEHVADKVSHTQQKVGSVLRPPPAQAATAAEGSVGATTPPPYAQGGQKGDSVAQAACMKFLTQTRQRRKYITSFTNRQKVVHDKKEQGSYLQVTRVGQNYAYTVYIHGNFGREIT